MTWVAAGIASGAATVAGVKYIKQKRDAKRDEKNRPKYEIPAEIEANMTQAEQMAMQGLPEEQKQQYINNLQRSQAFALNQAGTRKAGLAGLATINQQGVEGYGNLMAADAKARQDNQMLAMNARDVMADYKSQQWQLNRLNPFYENIARRIKRDEELAQGLNSAAGVAGGMNFGGKSNSAVSNTQQQSPQIQMSEAQGQPIYSSPPSQSGQIMDTQGQQGFNSWGKF